MITNATNTLILNNQESTVFSVLKSSLESCKRFYFNVAFINFPNVIINGGFNGYAKSENPKTEQKEIYYTVKKGDTLSEIAARCHTTVQSIASKNMNLNLACERVIFSS